MSTPSLSESEIRALTRPQPSLLFYYGLGSLLLGPFFFVALLPLYFRYHTLRYRFDEEGVSMRWGVLFRREIYLTYTRIQDIHLVSNVVERWLGLARIKIQTASGTSKAEMTIEGIEAFEALRDYLYGRMRGTGAGSPATERSSGSEDELVATLREVAAELRALRLAMEGARGPKDLPDA